MKITKILLTAVISVILLSTCALALGDDVIIDMGPIFGELVDVNPGDINNDGIIDAKDTSLLGSILATGGESFTYEQLAAANLYTDDDNGTQAVINIKDLIALAQLVSKIENGTDRTERIVSLSNVMKDESDLYFNYYDVFNPYLGRKETSIIGSLPGSNANIANGALPTGTKAELRSSAIYENEGYEAQDVINPESDFVWLIGYDLDEKTITVLPEGSTDMDDAITYVYNDNTCLSMLSYSEKADIFKWGIMNPVDIDDFYENLDKNYYRCYNNKIPDGDVYTTKYAKYIKAYISPIENTNVIDYAIIIVHEKEAVENLNI